MLRRQKRDASEEQAKKAKLEKSLKLFGLESEYYTWSIALDDAGSSFAEISDLFHDQYRRVTDCLSQKDYLIGSQFQTYYPVDTLETLKTSYQEVYQSLRDAGNTVLARRKAVEEVLYAALTQAEERQQKLDAASSRLLELLQNAVKAYAAHLSKKLPLADFSIKEFNALFIGFASIDASGTIAFDANISPENSWVVIKTLFEQIGTRVTNARRQYSSVTRAVATTDPDIALLMVKRLQPNFELLQEQTQAHAEQFKQHKLVLTTSFADTTTFVSECANRRAQVATYTENVDVIEKLCDDTILAHREDVSLREQNEREQLRTKALRNATLIETAAERIKKQLPLFERATCYNDVRFCLTNAKAKSSNPEKLTTVTEDLQFMEEAVAEIGMSISKVKELAEIHLEATRKLRDSTKLLENFVTEDNWNAYIAQKNEAKAVVERELTVDVQMPPSPIAVSFGMGPSPSSVLSVTTPTSAASTPTADGNNELSISSNSESTCREIYNLIRPILLDIEFARRQKSCLGSWSSVTILKDNNESESIHIPRGYAHIIKKIQEEETSKNPSYLGLLQELGTISSLRKKAGTGLFAKRSGGTDAVYDLLNMISTQLKQGQYDIAAVQQKIDNIRTEHNGNEAWNPSFAGTIDKLNEKQVRDVSGFKRVR